MAFPLRAPDRSPAINSPIQTYLERLHARHASLESGTVATYIPELGKADPNWFGIAIATIDGHVYEVGDSRQPFTIQSISKPITYGMALEDRGRDAVLAKVGVEPSGDAFNSISLAPDTGCPRNPMINAGAIATTSLVKGASAADRLERLLGVFSIYAGRPLSIDEEVYRSEKETGHRNRAIGHMLRNFDVLESDPDPALDLYFRQCSILVDTHDLAVIAATLANGGVNPQTGERAVRRELVESILSIMTTCGMYDFAGTWVYAVGMPAKSGVAGGVMAVLPGQLGIGVFSPPLDARGNSVRGVATCIEMSRDFGLHFLRAPRSSWASIRASYDLSQVHSRRLRSEMERRVLEATGAHVRIYELQGDLSFAAVETIVRRIVDVSATAEGAILDLRRVTHVEPAAVALFATLVEDLGDAEQVLALVGGESHGAFIRQLEERVSSSGHPAALHRFVDVDTALEWWEERLLAGAACAPLGAVTLAAHDLCHGLAADGLAVLAERLETRRYPHGDMIIREGDESGELFMLMAGRVSVSVDLPGGRRRRVATVSPGMVFGELTVVDHSARTANVRADTDVECLVLSSAALEALGVSHPAIKMTLLENLLRNVHRTVKRLSREVAAFEG